MTPEATSLRLEMNSQKTKVQALGCNHSLHVGQEVAMIEDFVYLGSFIRSTTQSSPDISCHNAITRMTVLNLYCVSKTAQLCNGIARNGMDRF